MNQALSYIISNEPAYIVPVLTYASETWTPSKSDDTLLAELERKMLRSKLTGWHLSPYRRLIFGEAKMIREILQAIWVYLFIYFVYITDGPSCLIGNLIIKLRSI